ncbi:hypothetical protein C2S51_007882 [Perilla frutescens var. frutescens]|nr:hypothetical protein C2S51_007882 [Perilla frutescens var. frutescens]
MASRILMRRSHDRVDSRRHFLTSISDGWSRITNLYAAYDPELPEDYDPDFAGCCKGLLCLQYRNCEYAFWNPATNECKLLPRIGFQDLPCPFKSCKGNCILSLRSVVTSLGFDDTSQDYKFIAFVDMYYEEGAYYHHVTHKIALYSLKYNSWKEIQYLGPCDILDGDGTCVKNGFCYWKCDDHIVSFSFVTEEFSTLPYPDVIVRKRGIGIGDMFVEYNLLLMDFEGSVGAVVHPKLGNVKLFSFWVWSEGSWTRKTEFDVRLIGARRPLSWFCNNFLFEGMNGELLEYDYSKQELKRIDQVYDYPFEMHVYPFPHIETTTPQLGGKIAASTLDRSDRKKMHKEIKRQTTGATSR